MIATDGTAAYDFTDGVDAVEAPTEILNRAAMWLDASQPGGVLVSTNIVVSTGEDGAEITNLTINAENWLDVREDQTAAAGGVYTYPRAEASRHYFDRVPSLTTVDDRATINFGGPGSGRFMVWRTPDGGTNTLKIAHAFIVVGIVNRPAWIIGSVVNGGWDTNSDGLWDSTTMASQLGTVRVDGRNYELYDSEAVRGFRLLEIDMGGVPITQTADCFFNCKNYQDDSPNGSTGGGKRGGGDNLSEVVLFTEPLTVEERLQVEAYLLAKWQLDTHSRRALSLAANRSATAQAVATAASDDALEMLGDGVVVKTGARDAYVVPSLAGGVAIAPKPATPRGGNASFSRSRINSFDDAGRTFAGQVRVGAGALYLNAPVALAVAGGETVTAALDTEGNRVTVAAGGADDRAVKQGDGDIVIDRLPAEVKRFETKAGTTVLKAPGGSRQTAWANPNVGLKATIPNHDFEDVVYTGDKKYVNLLGTTYNGWTGYSDDGTPVNTAAGISGRKDDTQGYDSYGTSYNLPAPHGGDGQLVLQYKASAKAAISLPADGYYDLTFYMACSGWVGSSENARMLAIDVQIEEPDGECRTVGRAYALRYNTDENKRYRLVRMRTPYLTAGEKTFRFQNATGRETGVVIDDIDMTCLPDMPDERVVPVPNGDFERYAGAQTYVYYDQVSATNNTAEGWIFEQPDDWDGVTYPRAPRVGLIFGNRQLRDLCLDGQRFGPSYGEAALIFANKNGVARQQHIPLKAGTYRLRGKASARTMWNYGNAWDTWDGSYVSATVKLSDGTAIDLGTLNLLRQIPQRYCWPNEFTLAADDEIELSLVGGNQRIAIVDDLEFIASGVQPVNLVQNGNFEQAASGSMPALWSKTVGDGSSSVLHLTHGEWYDSHYMKGYFEGKRYVKLTGTAAISQVVTVPAAGVYRFTMHEHTRITGNDKPGIKVTMTDADSVETTLCRIEPANDKAREMMRRQCYFRLPAAGDYTLTIATLNEAGDDKSSLIDDVRLERVDASSEAAVPEMDAATELYVAEGAKMRLDYTGRLVVGRLSLGGKRHYGVIRAADFPGYLDGPGEIEVRPRAFKLIVR
ncbi:MAG: hypothetical protein ACI4RD_08720 [Kiritimatiellia bacterium]